MPTRDGAHTLLRDERGAMMVMGIFMCSCLVASLWYLAGIGDAILYRERLQETADAVAFSEAALHARGMNLIVLINLIMSVILSIRVALRVGKLVLTVEAVVFAALGVIPGNGGFEIIAAPTGGGAVALANFDNATKGAIDAALNALVLVEEGIARATPGFSKLAATTSVGGKYGGSVATSEPSLTSLPVAAGDPTVLCDHAADVVPKLNESLFKKANLGFLNTFPGNLVTLVIGAAVHSDTDYFCDLEAGKSKPGSGSEAQDTADKRCSDPSRLLDNEKATFDKAEGDWIEACANAGVRCTGKDASGRPLLKGTQTGIARGGKAVQDDLDRRALHRDESAQAIQQLLRDPRPLVDKTACKAWAVNDFQERLANDEALNKQQQDKSQDQQDQQDDSTSQGDSGIAPMAVSGFENGSKEGQIFAAAITRSAAFDRDAKIVRIGAFNSKKTPTLTAPANAKIPALAQAEFFYDCDKAWKDCNDKDDAMWNFQWRARLRRVNQPVQSVLVELSLELGQPPPLQGPDAFARKVAQEALAPSATFHPNNALRHDLANSLNDATTQSQGVH